MNDDEEDSDEKPIEIELKIDRNSDFDLNKNKLFDERLTERSNKLKIEQIIEEKAKSEKIEPKQENHIDSFKKLEELRSSKNEGKSQFSLKQSHPKTNEDKISKKLKDSMKNEFLDNEFKIKIPETLFKKT